MSTKDSGNTIVLIPLQFQKEFLLIVFIPSKEEDEDRITCGNSLIAIAE